VPRIPRVFVYLLKLAIKTAPGAIQLETLRKIHSAFFRMCGKTEAAAAAAAAATTTTGFVVQNIHLDPLDYPSTSFPLGLQRWLECLVEFSGWWVDGAVRE